MIRVEELNLDKHLCDFIKIHNEPAVAKSFGICDVCEESIAKIFYCYLEDNKSGKARHCAIIDSANNRLIGSIGVYNIDPRNQRASSYCLVDKRYWRMGISMSASKLFYPFVFESLNINRIEAKVESNNMAAIKSLLMIGYTQEGKLREYELVEGIYIDIIVFSLLKSDYNESK